MLLQRVSVLETMLLQRMSSLRMFVQVTLVLQGLSVQLAMLLQRMSALDNPMLFRESLPSELSDSYYQDSSPGVTKSFH